MRGTLAGVFAAGTVLVIGWQVGSAASAHTTTALGSSTTGSASTGGTSTTSAASTSGLKDGTYTGDAEQTRYGNMQVQVTVSGGRITDVTALQVTDRDPRSQQISSNAVPVLQQEVLASQSANVQYVSGATYTSDGYLRSVQSALDQAS